MKKALGNTLSWDMLSQADRKQLVLILREEGHLLDRDDKERIQQELQKRKLLHRMARKRGVNLAN